MSDSVAWMPYQVEFVSDLDQPDLGLEPWSGHRWFAYDLARWAKPSRIVELGSFTGCSFFAFCQAVVDGQMESEVLAIGAWKTEETSDVDGEEVFESFSSMIERRFGTVNTRIHRSTFDDALGQVPDASVDLLHLDGLDSYDSVRQDLSAWLPKLAANGIVLLHGVAQSSGSGPSQLWQEVQESGLGLAFLHGQGLGVLLPNGTAGREALVELSHSPWRTYYDHRAGHDLARRQIGHLAQLLEDHEEAVASARKLVAAKDDELGVLKSKLADKSTSLVAAEESMAKSADELARARRFLGTREAELAEARRTLERRERELSLAAAAQQDLQTELSKVIDQRDRLDGERAQAEVKADQLEQHLAIVSADRDAQAERLASYRRALGPVRWASRPGRKLFRRLAQRSMPELGAGTPAGPAGSAEGRTRAKGGSGATIQARREPGAEPGTSTDLESDAAIVHPPEPPILLDPDWYLSRYPDVSRLAVDPVTHFNTSGWKEGRDPSPLFSVSWYRERYGQRLLGSQTPLEHYLDHGLPEGGFVAEAHEATVLESAPLAGREEEILSDLAIQVPSGARQSIPPSALAELDADLVSFDLWDSILVRTRPADAAPLATARRIRVALGLRADESPNTWELVERRREIETSTAGPNNGEFLLHDVLSQQLGELVRPGRFDVPTLTESLVRAELDDEKSATVPIGEVVVAIERLLARSDGPQVAVVSEFHFSTDDLRELLASHGLTDSRIQVVSSGDAGVSSPGKGALLEWVRRHAGVSAERHIHVGDDANTDVAIQNVTGGAAVHLLHGRRRFPEAGKLRDDLVGVTAELRVELDSAGRLRCRQQAGTRPRAANRLITAGWLSSILPVALVAAGIEEAVSHDQDRVHYLGREGLFLARVHDAVSHVLAPDHPTTAVHLAVSRQSTFGPSLHQISMSSLGDLWRLYPRQTPRDVLLALGAEVEEFAAELRHHDLDPEELIGGIHLDERVRGLIEDSANSWRLRQINDDRRSALLGYLSRRLDLEAHELVVVSADWQGAIQDNLARLLPKSRFIGWHLALLPFENDQAENVEKHAIGPNANQDQPVSFLDPVEAIERQWTPPTPDVIGYRAKGTGGSRVEAVLDEQILPEAARNAITLQQDAMVEAAPMVARWIVANGMATDILRTVVASELARFYSNPEPGVADLCFDTEFDTTFGRPSIVNFATERPDKSWLADGPGQTFRDRLDRAALATLWPAGFRRWQPVEAATALERALRSNRFQK